MRIFIPQETNTPEEPILEQLWQFYSERHPVTDSQVRACEATLEPIFLELSPDAADGLFDSISELVIAYQRAAFWDGFRLGLRLWQELSDETRKRPPLKIAAALAYEKLTWRP